MEREMPNIKERPGDWALAVIIPIAAVLVIMSSKELVEDARASDERPLVASHTNAPSK